MEPGGEGRERLAERLRARIARDGPMTFAEFMEHALYDPDEGFYARPPIGPERHFVTSPHASEAFGLLLARQIEDVWELLDKPDPFPVVEVGAGDGTLAMQVVAALPVPVRDALRYVAVERSPGAREALRRLEIGVPVRVAESLAEVDDGLEGCVLGNEVLDNVPFHRVRRTEEGVVELRVDAEADRFVTVEAPAPDELVALTPDGWLGEEAVVSPEALRVLDGMTGLLRRGYALLIDYGFASLKRTRSVHGYRDHRLEDDVLADPGSRDITSGVDFEALTRHAEGRGLKVWGPISQRDALMALGFRAWDAGAREDQVRALAEGRGLEATRIYAARSRAGLLVDPMGLGGFHAVGLGVGVDAQPLMFRPR